MFNTRPGIRGTVVSKAGPLSATGELTVLQMSKKAMIILGDKCWERLKLYFDGAHRRAIRTRAGQGKERWSAKIPEKSVHIELMNTSHGKLSILWDISSYNL